MPYIWYVLWLFFITVKITENFRFENIWCRSKSPFPPRNGRFQITNAAEARNSCATYIAYHVWTKPILKTIEESWVGLRRYSRDVQKWSYFGLFWKKQKAPESKCMALDGSCNTVTLLKLFLYFVHYPTGLLHKIEVISRQLNQISPHLGFRYTVHRSYVTLRLITTIFFHMKSNWICLLA